MKRWPILFIPAMVQAVPQVDLDRESLRLREQGGVAQLYVSSEAGPTEAAPGDPVVSRGRETPREAAVTPRARTRAELLEAVDAGWSWPYDPTVLPAERADPQQAAIRNRLKDVYLPKVEFRRLPLSEVVETLSEMSLAHSPDGQGLNMVLMDPEGRDPYVSILLRRLSLERILDFIVESVGYEYDLQADAVIIRPGQGPGFGLETAFYPISRSTLIRLTGLPDDPQLGAVAGIQDPFSDVARHEPEGRNRSEEALRSFLQRAGIPFSGIEGASLALADGQLIVTQTPRNHSKVERLLRRYREIKQVEIEARFLEVQERNLEELGLEWTLVGEDGDTLSNAPVRTLSNAFTVGRDESRILIERSEGDAPSLSQGPPILPIQVDLAEEARPALNLTTPLGELDLKLLVRALERQSGNDLLSAPKLTVLSGKTAEIVVAEEFRYPESYGDTSAEVGTGDSTSGSAGVAITAGTPRSFTTRNVGVEMEVTPTVEEDNAISLLLKPKVTEFEGFVEFGGPSIAIASGTTVTVPSGFYQPVFSIRKVQTEVTIWDGATVVMGGLTREHAVRIADKIPLLGDLPLLGRLFRSEGESTQKRNLLIIVTAKLVNPAGTHAMRPAPLENGSDAEERALP